MVKRETILAVLNLLDGMNRSDWKHMRDAIDRAFSEKSRELLRGVAFEASEGLAESIERYCNDW